MRRTALARRLERAIENAEQNDPDGPLSSYVWMWRALVRSSENRMGLYFKFARLVLVDTVFLAAWSVLRPIRTLLRSRLGQVSLVGSAALVASLLLLSSEPPSPLAQPWTGPLEIQVNTHGILLFQGVLVTDDEAFHLIELYGVKQAQVEIDGDVVAKRAFEIQDLLAEAGVEQVKTLQIGPAA